jgi:hypothetical protein
MQEHEAWDDFPDPWDDDHTIDYWIWRGDHLVLATPEGIGGIQEDDRAHRVSRRLDDLQARALRKARRMRRRRNAMCAPLIGCPPLVTPWLLAMRPQRRIAHEEGAHAEQSVTG